MADMAKHGISTAVRISTPVREHCYRFDDGNADTGLLFNLKMARKSLVTSKYVIVTKATADGSSNYKVNVGHHGTSGTLATDIHNGTSASGVALSIIGTEVVVAKDEYVTARLTETGGSTAAVAAGLKGFIWFTITPIPDE
jgi:hypothetical protein